MEFPAISFFQSHHFFPIFTPMAVVILLSATLIYAAVRSLHKFWCSCEICRSYVSSSWSKSFTNLSDWYTYLLQNSPTQTIHLHVLSNTIITANPSNVEHILKTKFHNYPKGKPFSTILGDLLGKGIFNVDGDSWLFQRKMASLELARISITRYAFEIVSQEIKSRLLPLLSSSVSQQVVFDLQEAFRRFSFDNICRFSFGLDPKCLDYSFQVSHFADSFDLASKISAERAMATLPFLWKMKRFFKIGNEKKLKEAIEVINMIAMEVILQKRKLASFSSNQDLLTRFMACVNDDSYLRDIVISFILAGRDTMASALTTLFYLLSKHPQVIVKIQQESRQVLSPNQELPSYDQIRNMHYLHAAIYESLRLYPPVQFDSKFAEEDDILPDGTRVSKGTRVTYHAYAMGRMEKIWGVDCMEFKPERWVDENGAFCPESPFNYPVFQGGVRTCLGKELALMEMKMVGVCIASKFEIEVVEPKGALRFDPGLTATLKGGLKVLLRERRDTTY